MSLGGLDDLRPQDLHGEDHIAESYQRVVDHADQDADVIDPIRNRVREHDHDQQEKPGQCLAAPLVAVVDHGGDPPAEDHQRAHNRDDDARRPGRGRPPTGTGDHSISSGPEEELPDASFATFQRREALEPPVQELGAAPLLVGHEEA